MRIIASLVMGAIFGSFAAAVADRVPRGQSVLSGRSRCRSCGDPIAARDLIPIVSWLVLRGWCRRCNARIPGTSFVVEILTAVLFAVFAHRFDDTLTLGAHWILVTGSMSLALIDLFTMRLPRRIIHVTAALGAPTLIAAAVITREPNRIGAAVLGALASLTGMWILRVASRRRLGDGDVRLSPLLGWYLGWSDLSAVASGFLLAFVLGAVIGLITMASNKMHRSTAIPFGPFLIVGTIATLVIGVDMVGVVAYPTM